MKKKKRGFWIFKVFNVMLTGGLLLLIISQIKMETPFTNFQFKTVLSGSMEPEFKAGDLLIVKDVPSTSLEVGDIISFTQVNETVTHRIVGVGRCQ